MMIEVIGAAEFPLAWIASAIGFGTAAGFGWATFRSKGRTELVNLLEQRVRIQDDEIERLQREKQVLADRNDLLINGFADRIVTVVERKMRDHDRRQGRS